MFMLLLLLLLFTCCCLLVVYLLLFTADLPGMFDVRIVNADLELAYKQLTQTIFGVSISSLMFVL